MSSFRRCDYSRQEYNTLVKNARGCILKHDDVYDPEENGQKSGKPRPIKVTFREPSDIFVVLKNKHKLRTSPVYESIRISPDRTLMQRNHLRVVLSKLKERKTAGESDLILKFVKENENTTLNSKNNFGHDNVYYTTATVALADCKSPFNDRVDDPKTEEYLKKFELEYQEVVNKRNNEKKKNEIKRQHIELENSVKYSNNKLCNIHEPHNNLAEMNKTKKNVDNFPSKTENSLNHSSCSDAKNSKVNIEDYNQNHDYGTSISNSSKNIEVKEKLSINNINEVDKNKEVNKNHIEKNISYFLPENPIDKTNQSENKNSKNTHVTINDKIQSKSLNNVFHEEIKSTDYKDHDMIKYKEQINEYLSNIKNCLQKKKENTTVSPNQKNDVIDSRKFYDMFYQLHTEMIKRKESLTGEKYQRLCSLGSCNNENIFYENIPAGEDIIKSYGYDIDHNTAHHNLCYHHSNNCPYPLENLDVNNCYPMEYYYDIAEGYYQNQPYYMYTDNYPEHRQNFIPFQNNCNCFCIAQQK